MTSTLTTVDRKELYRLVHKLCESLSILWADPDFRVYSYRSPYQQRRRSATTFSGEAMMLPRTKRPLRATEGVEVHAVDRDRTLADDVRELLSESFGNWSEPASSDVEHKQATFRQALASISEFVDQRNALWYRLYGAVGYKTFSPEALENHREEHGAHSNIMFWLSLVPVLAEALVDEGFDPLERSAFESWSASVDDTVARLGVLSERSDYEYEVRIFLNGPPIDSLNDVVIAELEVRGEPVQVCLAYATDALLDPLVDYTVFEGFDKVNTVLRYRTKVSVEADEPPYLQRYADASEVAELCVDVLRLVRCKEDIGVLALEIVELDSLTPKIRKTWANRYQPELARYQPHRFDFGPPSTVALTDAEVDRLRSAISSLLGGQGDFKGLKYALRRLRSSVERYSPSDPERLLEYAIALEALYLNDIGTDRGELSYRLRLRAARFLATDFGVRNELFVTLGDLYKLRSRVAHGESLEHLGKKDRRILETVLDRGPMILSQSVLRILENSDGSIPSGPSGDFWRRVELGGIEESRLNQEKAGKAQTSSTPENANVPSGAVSETG